MKQWVGRDGVNGTPTGCVDGKLQGGSPQSAQVAAQAVLAPTS